MKTKQTSNIKTTVSADEVACRKEGRADNRAVVCIITAADGVLQIPVDCTQHNESPLIANRRQKHQSYTQRRRGACTCRAPDAECWSSDGRYLYCLRSTRAVHSDKSQLVRQRRLRGSDALVATSAARDDKTLFTCIAKSVAK